MACGLDFSSLPILPGCPGDEEQVLVGNAAGGIDSQGNYTVGYGRRLMKDLIACFLGGLSFVTVKCIVGTTGPIGIGQTIIPIAQSNILEDSLFITLGGSELNRNDNTQISYSVVYSPTQMTITLNQGGQAGQIYLIHYAYVS